MGTDEELQRALDERTGPSFGITLTPFLMQQINRLADKTPLPLPHRVGALTKSEIDTLYEIALYPAKKWNVTGQSAFDAAEFTSFVNYKTQQTPSYFTAFQYLLAMYGTLEQQMGSDKAMNFLYTPDPSTPPANWEIVRYWAIQEFLALFITSGNFRSYGWVNFPGWMGGPYNNPSKLPYRGIDDG